MQRRFAGVRCGNGATPRPETGKRRQGMDLGIAGKNALVCASSKGLGRGCAQALADGRASNLVMNARGAEALEDGPPPRSRRANTACAVAAVRGRRDHRSRGRAAVLEAARRCRHPRDQRRRAAAAACGPTGTARISFAALDANMLSAHRADEGAPAADDGAALGPRRQHHLAERQSAPIAGARACPTPRARA